MKKTLAVFSLLMTISVAWANFNLPTDKNYPGGIAIIKLMPLSVKAPEVFYQHHRVLLQSKNHYWYAITGIALNAKTGHQQVTVIPAKGKTFTKSFSVKYRNYPLRHITIKDKSKVTPNPELAKKIALQKKQTRQLLNTWTQNSHVDLNFILPTKGWFSSYFGIRRIYNQTKLIRHTGLDVAAVTGTKVVAAASGTVLAVRDLVLTGNTVFINHGQGLITIYAHLSKVLVKPKQKVSPGEPIGAVGATGRVTGAHLHFEVILNGTKVNPTIFLKKQN